MSIPTEFFRWWIIDMRSGERRLTNYALTRADAERAFPGAEPDLQTRDLRHLPDPAAAPVDSRSGDGRATPDWFIVTAAGKPK